MISQIGLRKLKFVWLLLAFDLVEPVQFSLYENKFADLILSLNPARQLV